MAEKAVNYTPEQTAKIIADYQAGVAVEQIALATIAHGDGVCTTFIPQISKDKKFEPKNATTKKRKLSTR